MISPSFYLIEKGGGFMTVLTALISAIAIIAVVLISIFGKNLKKLKISFIGIFKLELENKTNEKAGALTPTDSKELK